MILFVRASWVRASPLKCSRSSGRSTSTGRSPPPPPSYRASGSATQRTRTSTRKPHGDLAYKYRENNYFFVNLTLQEDPHQGAGPKLWHCVERGGLGRSSFGIVFIVNYCVERTLVLGIFYNLMGIYCALFHSLCRVISCQRMRGDPDNPNQQETPADTWRKVCCTLRPARSQRAKKPHFCTCTTQSGYAFFF